MQYPKIKLVFIGVIIFFISSSTTLKSYIKVGNQKENPQIILVLGGDIKREKVGVKTASQLKIPLIVSGGSNPEHAKWLVSQSNVSSSQVILDYRAHDTLTNFTSIIDDLLAKGIDHILMITSEDHIARASAVGYIVAGSKGIRISTIAVPCHPKCNYESHQKKVFDVLRAIIWVVSGKDVKSIAEKDWKGVIEKSLSFKSLIN